MCNHFQKERVVDTKLVSAVLSKIGGLQKCNLAILRTPLVSKGVISATNLDSYIQIDTGESVSGWLNMGLLSKSQSLELSLMKVPGIEFTDFPLCPAPIERHELPISLLERDLTQFPQFAARDISRAVLQGTAFIREQGWIAATDGHKALVDILQPGELDCSFVLSPETVAILAALRKIGSVTSASVFRTEAFSIPPLPQVIPGDGMDEQMAKDILAKQAEQNERYEKGKREWSWKYLEVNGDKWHAVFKLVEGPYPDLHRVIPNNSNKVVYSKEMRWRFIAGVTALLPIANRKTDLIIFGPEGMMVRNSELEKYWRMKIPGLVPAVKTVKERSEDHKTEIEKQVPFHQFGMNGVYAKLAFGVHTAGVTVELPDNPIGGIVIRGRDRFTLLMPLRIHEAEKGEEKEEAKPVKYQDLIFNGAGRPEPSKPDRILVKYERRLPPSSSIPGQFVITRSGLAIEDEIYTYLSGLGFRAPTEPEAAWWDDDLGCEVVITSMERISEYCYGILEKFGLLPAVSEKSATADNTTPGSQSGQEADAEHESTPQAKSEQEPEPLSGSGIEPQVQEQPTLVPV